MEFSRTMFVRSAIAVGILSALVIAPTAAQTPVPVDSPKIIVSNGLGTGNPVELPLASTGPEATLQFLSNGDLQVNCRLDDGKCPNIGTGGGGTGAALTFGRTPTTATINSGVGNLNLNWSSPDSDACFAIGPTGVAQWNDNALPRTGNRTLTAQVTQNTTMDFGIRCFTAEGGVSEASTSVEVLAGSTGDGPGGEPFCQEYYPSGSPDPAFTAYGMLNKVERSWSEVFGSQPGQVSTAGDGGRVGVPGFFLPTSTGNYLALPFVITSATDPIMRSMKVVWAEASGNDGIQTGPVVVTVSPCAGDFRTRSGFANPNDTYVSGVCGGSGTQSSGITISAIGSGISGCQVPVGKLMYLNITTYGINSTTQPTSNSCGTGGAQCGVRMRIEE